MTRRRRKRLTRAPVRRLRRAKLVWERNMNRREVSKTSESIEKNEILEKAASKRKEEVINKHDTDKEKEVIKHEKETRKAHSLTSKGSRYAQRSPPEKKLKSSRLQGKHLEEEQESQGALPAGKNQARSSPVQGTELEDENRTRERPDKIKAEPVKFISRWELEELKVVGMIQEEAPGWD